MEVQSFLKWHCRPPPFPLPRFPPHLFPSSQSLVLFNAKKSTLFQNHKPSFPSSCRRSKSLSISAAAAVALQTDKDRLPDDIQVTETKEPHSRVRLSVSVSPLVCQDCYNRVLEEFAKQSKVPGFRPGKRIPENILINYIGKQYVQRAAIESILKRTLSHAMSSVTGRALKDSIQILTKFSEMDGVFSPQDFLRYEVVVDVAPEVKWVSKNAYKNLKIVVELDNDINAEKASEVELRRRHKNLGSLRIVTDRGLQIGDVVVLDIFAATIDEGDSNGERIPSAESRGFHLDTEEADYLLPGFLNSIMGIQRGETKSFPLQFPESWNEENLRGIVAQFTVECKELFCRDLPELDDSLADRLLSGCSTLSQVREAILQRCREVEQTARDQATDNAILNQLCKLIDVEIPQSLFEEQGRQLYGAKLLELQARRKLNEQQLGSLTSEKSFNEYLEIQRDNITNIIKQTLAVREIFKHENLQFSTEELVKEVENSIAEFEHHNQEYDEERIKEQVSLPIANQDASIVRASMNLFPLEVCSKETKDSLRRKLQEIHSHMRIIIQVPWTEHMFPSETSLQMPLTTQVQDILEGAKVLEWLREDADIQYVTK